MNIKTIIKSLRLVFDSDRLGEVANALAGNKSRTVLTAFGIFWGVFMLVLLLGGGKGLQKIMLSQFGGFAENTGVIGTQNTTKAYKGYAKGREWNLKAEDANGLRNGVNGLDVVLPIVTEWGFSAKHDKRSHSGITLKGVVPDYKKIEMPTMAYGRYINDNDVRLSRKVCVIGKRVYEELFPDGGNPCGKYICVDGVYYEVIGVDVRKSNIALGGQASESVQVPYNVMRNIYNYGNSVDMIAFTAKRGVTVASLESRIRHYITHIHDIHPDDKEAMIYFNAETLFQMFDNLFRGINILVWLIGIGTVVSGIIGVTNIMLVSIRERTVELGIRRAIGAKPRDILMQILTECEIMTILAGFSGIVAATGILATAETLVSKNAESPVSFQIPFNIAFGVALALSVLGLLAGIFPAARALAIKPVDAMRDE